MTRISRSAPPTSDQRLIRPVRMSLSWARVRLRTPASSDARKRIAWFGDHALHRLLCFYSALLLGVRRVAACKHEERD